MNTISHISVEKLNLILVSERRVCVLILLPPPIRRWVSDLDRIRKSLAKS